MKSSFVEPGLGSVEIGPESCGTNWTRSRSCQGSQHPELGIRAGACSVQGRQRMGNQDCLYCDPAGLFLVADGMGGMQSGDVASRIAVDALSRRLAPARFRGLSSRDVVRAVSDALVDMHHEIRRVGRQDPERRGMGTTIVVGLCLASQFYVAHAGDSRAYRLRRGVLAQLTVDHTMAQSLLDCGAISPGEAACHHWRHLLWNGLGGIDGECEPYMRVFDLWPCDRFVLTTDGLTNAVSDEVIRQTMSSLADPVDAAQHLVNAAVAAEASDDATCVAIYFDSQGSQNPPPADFPHNGGG